MSLESAKAFIERIKTDEDFAKEANKCKDREMHVDFVKSHGFDFTAEEILKIKNELSDVECEIITGAGMGQGCLPYGTPTQGTGNIRGPY